MNIVMKPRTLVASVLPCRFHDNIHVIKFSFLKGWLLSSEWKDLNVVYQTSMLEILRHAFLCFLFYDSTEFSIWKNISIKTLLSLQKKFLWRKKYLIFSLFIKRSGNRKNALKLSCMYICTFQDINKQTLLQWQLTSYHNIIIHFHLHLQVIVYVTYLKS